MSPQPPLPGCRGRGCVRRAGLIPTAGPAPVMVPAAGPTGHVGHRQKAPRLRRRGRTSPAGTIPPKLPNWISVECVPGGSVNIGLESIWCRDSRAMSAVSLALVLRVMRPATLSSCAGRRHEAPTPLGGTRTYPVRRGGIRAQQRRGGSAAGLAAPVSFKGRLVQYVGRIIRPYPGKTVATVHDYYDESTPVLAASLNKRAPGYISLGFPDPRKITIR
jgi:hypothetical protein